MTVNTTNTKHIYDTGNGVREWPFTFDVKNAEDIKIFTSNKWGEDVQRITANYTINLTAKTIIYPNAGIEPLPEGKRIVIARIAGLDQQKIFEQNNFHAPEVERGLDKAAMQIQQLQEEIDRCLRFSIADMPDITDVIRTLKHLNDTAAQIKANADAAAASQGAAAGSATAAAASAANAAASQSEAAGSASNAAQSAATAAASENNASQSAAAAAQSATAAQTSADNAAQSASSAGAAASAAATSENNAAASAATAAEKAQRSEDFADNAYIYQNNSAASANAAAASAESISGETAQIEQNTADIAAEVERAEAAEQNIASALANEASRAETAEESNSNAIGAEVSRATAAEQALANSKQANLTPEQLAVVNENPFTDDDIAAIEQNAESIADNAEDIAAINGKIPSAASSSNKLADQAFVNSSIISQASNSVYADAAGNQFATRAALLAATTFYREGAAYAPSNNDYTIVLADEGAPAPFAGGQTRWKWTGSPAALGYEFGVNESPFTSGQNAAINSGFTSGDKAALDAHLADTIKHITSTERTVWNAKQAALSQEQLEVVNNEPYTAAEQTKLANITEGTPPDNATLEISAGNLRVKPQTTLSSISESTAKFAASTPFAFGDFFNNAVAKINGIISALSNVVPNTRTVNGKALSADITLAKGDVGLGNVANAAAVLQTADIIGMAVAADDAAAKAYSDAHPGVVTFGYED